MSEEHISVKLSLTPLPNNRYRSRIEESPAGASRGAGNDFDLPIIPCGEYPQFIREIFDGKHQEDEMQKVGQELFQKVFAGDVGRAFEKARSFATGRNAFLRLAVSALCPELVRIPWEFFHDGTGYLLQAPKIHLVRVLDELPEQMAPFRPFAKLLLVVANPKSDGYGRFEFDDHVNNLMKSIEQMGARVKLVLSASPDILHKTIEDEEFDAFYFLGHGSADGNNEGQIILESKTGEAEPLSANILAQWLANSGKQVYFAYFNSCRTAVISRNNTFAGVAQRILRDGKIPAVVAQQAPVVAQQSMRVAEQFLKRLRRGDSPEVAISSARSMADGVGWGIPTLYTHMRGAEEFERNRIETLLEANRDSNFALYLAGIQRGVNMADLEEGKARVTVVPEKLGYRGVTHPRTAVMAAYEILDLLLKIVPRDQITILPGGAATEKAATHQVFFGGRYGRAVMKAYGARLQFNPDDKWVIKDSESGREYRISDPTQMSSEEFANSPDYGIIEKMVDESNNRIYLVIAGLGDRATRGCAWYFCQHWSEILNNHIRGPFSILLELPKERREFHQMRRIDPGTGKPISASA